MRTTPVEGERLLRASGLWAAARRSSDGVALTLVLLLLVWWWFALAIQGSPGDWAFDFRQFWQGGRDVVDGVSPYPSADLLASAGDHLDPEGIRETFRFPYPAGAAVALAPLGALAFETAAAIWSALLIGALLGALWILRVRDWRVLAVVVSSAPAITAVRLGTFTPLLVLLLAVAWRWRMRPWVSGGALAVAIALKLFVWPAVVWLVATRRYAAAAIAAAGAALVTFAAWAAIGFDGLGDYPQLLRRLSDVVADRGYSLVAAGTALGLPHAVAALVPWLVGGALLLVMVLGARRGGSEPRTYSLAIVAALALTPIVWLHYFTLVVLPLALVRPRFTWVWALLWLFWLTPVQEAGGELWRIVLAAAVSTLAIALVPTARSRGPEAHA